MREAESERARDWRACVLVNCAAPGPADETWRDWRARTFLTVSCSSRSVCCCVCTALTFACSALLCTLPCAARPLSAWSVDASTRDPGRIKRSLPGRDCLIVASASLPRSLRWVCEVSAGVRASSPVLLDWSLSTCRWATREFVLCVFGESAFYRVWNCRSLLTSLWKFPVSLKSSTFYPWSSLFLICDFVIFRLYALACFSLRKAAGGSKALAACHFFFWLCCCLPGFDEVTVVFLWEFNTGVNSIWWELWLIEWCGKSIVYRHRLVSLVREELFASGLWCSVCNRRCDVRRWVSRWGLLFFNAS